MLIGLSLPSLSFLAVFYSRIIFAITLQLGISLRNFAFTFNDLFYCFRAQQDVIFLIKEVFYRSTDTKKANINATVRTNGLSWMIRSKSYPIQRAMVMNMIFMTIIIRISSKSNRGSMIMLRKISSFEYDVTLTASKTR